MKKPRNVIGFAILVIILLGTLWGGIVESNAPQPLSAANMTEKQRSDNDKNVLMKYLKEYDVEKIDVDYKYDSITLHIKAKSSDQYVSDKAAKIKRDARDILEERRAELTLEKDSHKYMIIVIGKDGHVIK
ncbi:hypothetical protein [Neobacillus mesonae]|uniref:hypothetical protein n=1 Tax=Neobacillus mesonae TaxID=1193713 RepID=UPI000FD9866A|nr:hypothetical protein [Neobacillus mesonae]